MHSLTSDYRFVLRFLHHLVYNLKKSRRQHKFLWHRRFFCDTILAAIIEFVWQPPLLSDEPNIPLQARAECGINQKNVRGKLL